jgi:hypothetical protein
MHGIDGASKIGAVDRSGVAATLLLGISIVLLLWTLQLAFRNFEPTADYATRLLLELSPTLLLVGLGTFVLFGIRSLDWATYLCIGGVLLAVALVGGGLFILATGYTPSKYNSISVPRIRCIPYFIVAVIDLLVTVAAIKRRQQLWHP